jgi:hypothetical protein
MVADGPSRKEEQLGPPAMARGHPKFPTTIPYKIELVEGLYFCRGNLVKPRDEYRLVWSSSLGRDAVKGLETPRHSRRAHRPPTGRCRRSVES